MKRILYSLLLLTSLGTFAQVGVGTTTPNGALDVSSSTNGFVPPRVALTSIIIEAPVVNPQGGLIPAGTVVYNIATDGTSPNNVAPGLYFWNGTRWVAFAGSPGGLDWTLTGNGGTTAATNFVGTTDSQDLQLRTNNLERITVSATGNVGIGIAPTSKLHIYEATGTTPTATTGTLVLDHGNTGGGSSIVFPSRVNNGSDYGYIRYDDDASGNGSTNENSLLEIGIQNDVLDTYQDDIAIMPSGNLGVGTRAPKAKFHNNGTTAFTTATSGTNNTILLLNGGTFATPAASAENSGMVYIIRNTRTGGGATNNVTVNNIIPYNSTTASNFTLTPAIGSIMIVSNGTNWYRIN